MVLAGVAACSEDDSYFQALLADPVAEYEPPGTELIRRSENPATGFLVRGRTAPHILSQYSFLVGADPDSVFEETLAYADSVGWAFEREPATTSTGYLLAEASKDIGLPTQAKLVVAIVDPNEFSVRLTYPEGIP